MPSAVDMNYERKLREAVLNSVLLNTYFSSDKLYSTLTSVLISYVATMSCDEEDK